MQELIEKLANKSGDSFYALAFYHDNDEIIKEGLEKEKEQIMKSYKDHHDLGHIYGLDTEEYYYDIYKSFIKKITITEFNQNK